MTWLQWLLRPIISITRTTVITPVAVRPGDDLVLSLDHLSASQDAVGLLRAAQEQFPGVRLHLLVGFAGVEVVRQKNDSDSCGCADQCGCQPRGAVDEGLSLVFAPPLESGAQRNVVILSHATGSHIVAATVPPEVKRDSFVQAHIQPIEKSTSDNYTARGAPDTGGVASGMPG